MVMYFPYNTNGTVRFPIIGSGTAAFVASASGSLVGTNVLISKDGGAWATSTNTGTYLPGSGWYAVPLTTSEFSAKEILISIAGGTLGTVVEHQGIIIHTYGSASAHISNDFPTLWSSQTIGTVSAVLTGTITTVTNNVTAATALGTVSANVVAVLGTAAGGTQGTLHVSSKQIGTYNITGSAGTNFGVFFHNAGVITVKTVDDVGVSSGTFDANVIEVLGTAVGGTQGTLHVSSKQIGTYNITGSAGTNFGVFFHNAGVIGTQTVDDVGVGGTPGVNVIQILGTAAGGTQGTLHVSSKQIGTYNITGSAGTNFGVFFHNAGAITVKTVDDVGVSSGTFDANIIQVKGTGVPGTQGTLVVDAGGLSGTIDANIVNVKGTAAPGTQGTLGVSVAGITSANLVQSLGTAITGTQGKPDVDVARISRDAVAADNLESQYDGDGIVGDNFPSTQSQLSGLANVGSAIHRPAASYVLTTGTQSANTVSSTQALDGTRHEHTDVGGELDLYYQFEIGAGVASSVQVTGYLTNNNDDLEILAFDWVTSAWVQIGTLDGLNAATNRVFNFDLFVDMTGTGSNFGLVRVRFDDGAFTLTTSTLAIDQIFVAFSQSSGGYENGAVWLDTNASNTNTVPGVDGISTNPVSTIGAVNTLLAATNLNRVEIAPNSSVTFAAAQENQEFHGLNWALALGGQSISNSHITGADVSGTMTASVEAHFDHCEMEDCTLGGAHIDACDIAGDLTLSAAATYFILGCYHSKSDSPVIDFGTAVGVNTTIHIHDYHGAITVANMGQSGTDVLHFSSPDGKLTLNSNNIGGTVNLNGVFDLVDNGSGQTINQDGRLSKPVVNAEVLDVLNVDTFAEPSSVPAATATIVNKIGWVTSMARNPLIQSSTKFQLRNDGGTGDIGTAAISDDGVTATRTKFV